jgi:hypothetical protein
VLETRDNQHFAKGSDSAAAKSAGGGGGGKAGSNNIHILCTSNGSPYQSEPPRCFATPACLPPPARCHQHAPNRRADYQLRIAYSTYKLVQKMPGGERHVGFTRILHRTVDDELMGEVPTFRAEPLQPKCDGWCEYPVSDRANAVRQFFAAAKADASMLKANWLYMIESDYVFMKPLNLPPAGAGAGSAWAFPFDYIKPLSFPTQVRKLYPEAAGPLGDVPGSGPAPVLMQRSDWEKVTVDWERLTAVIEADERLKKDLVW